MSGSSKHILIVNFDFPPNQGIGGRRWAKFAKELARRGYSVHVIKADPIADNAPSSWTADVQSENIRVYSLPRKYPRAFSHPGKDILSKIRYRIARKNLYRKERGTIYDLAIGWEPVFLQKASEIVRAYSIQNIIASGAPWYLLVYATKLKALFPGLNLVADFRDPWLNAKNYGMADLNTERRKAEEEKFAFVAKNADTIIAPNDEMIVDLKKFAGASTNCRFETITHTFDPDDMPIPASKRKDDFIRIVYGGDLYLGLEEQLKVLRDQILQMKREFPDLYNKLQIKIFTNAGKPSILEGLEPVEVCTSIGKSIFDELNNADYGMILLTDSKRNEPTTKFIELLPMRKPLLVIAPEGNITEMVRNERLGIVVDAVNLSSLSQQLMHPVKFNDSYDITRYKLDAVTDRLCALLR